MTLKLDFDRFHTALGDRSVLRFQGRVAQVIGLSRQETTKACKLAGKLAVAGCKAVAPDSQKTIASR